MPPLRPFEDTLEEAPVMALLIDRQLQVVAANQAARSFFGLDPDRLPASLMEATREARLVELMRAGQAENEARLAHHGRTVRTKLVPGPQSGETLMFLTDVTELRHLATVRQEFVANLTHELRTPLTSLRLALEALAGELSASARRTFAQRALKEADHLASILDNLRELAEIEAGQVPVERSPFELLALVEETLERLRFERPVTVEVAATLEVQADRAKTAQVLANLLDNAQKFSPPKSPVEVVATPLADQVEIRIRDRGPGLAPEHWERVFERFYKVDTARSRATTGSGLGLSIAKHLVLLQGGRIWTQAAEGGGQVFAFTLPLKQP